MAMEIIPAIALVMGLYLWYQVDKQEKTGSKMIYTFAGLVASIWALIMLFGAYRISIGFEPVVFGAAMIGALHSKGSKQAILWAVSLLIFLSIVL